MKFEVPFDAKIVFSTNLEPRALGDEAFFRRIQSKILVPTIADEQFDEVLRRVRRKRHGVELSPDAAGPPAQGQPRAWATATCGRTCRPRCARSSSRSAPTSRCLRVLDKAHDRPHRRDLLHPRDAGCTASVVAHHPRARGREEQPRGPGTPASGVQQATDPETAQLQRRQAAQAQTPAAAVPQQPTGGSTSVPTHPKLALKRTHVVGFSADFQGWSLRSDPSSPWPQRCPPRGSARPRREPALRRRWPGQEDVSRTNSPTAR